MNTTTTIDLDRLEALAKAATPGPWRASQNDVFAGPRYRIAQGVTAGGSSKSMADERKWQLGNAAFIAAANPAAILELIQLARRSNAGEAAADSKLMREKTATIKAHQVVLAERDAEIADLRAALATQQAAREQQEPVATVRVTHGGYGMELSTHIAYALPEGKHDLYAAPVAQQERQKAQTEAGSIDTPEFRALFTACMESADASGDERKAAWSAFVSRIDSRPTCKQSEAGASKCAVCNGTRCVPGVPFDPPNECEACFDQEPTSGRESAAPGAQQDAKDAALQAAREWIVTARPALTISRQATIDAYFAVLGKIDAAMQKGAQA